jgi:uncharacterized protein YbjT (DUF2867 family)
MNILITGATGNVGQSIFSAFSEGEFDANIIAGVRNPDKTVEKGEIATPFSVREFDFGKSENFSQYLKGIEVLFLLRPPNIADVNAVFKPLIEAAREAGVQHIVFLSVQGAEKQSYIPHHKIEKLIVDSGITYTFLRPAYFMQNFITTLHKDIVERNRIYLPAGKARFTIVDVKDVGAVAAKVLLNPEKHQNKAYELTNDELKNFGELTEQINQAWEKNIEYVSPNLLSFIYQKLKQGNNLIFTFVLIMLHYFPRFREAPKVSPNIELLLGRKPTSFEEFLEREII